MLSSSSIYIILSALSHSSVYYCFRFPQIISVFDFLDIIKTRFAASQRPARIIQPCMATPIVFTVRELNKGGGPTPKDPGDYENTKMRIRRRSSTTILFVN